MATTIYFPLCDNLTNPLTGSKVTLRAVDSPPYLTGSISNPTCSFSGPTTVYSDSDGIATFPKVIKGLYSVSWTNANANLPSAYQKFDETRIFISVDETNGQTINGFTYRVVSINTTNETAVAWSTTASDNRYLSGSGVSSSYSNVAVSSSFNVAIPQIQSGQVTNITNTGSIITFNTPFKDTNYSFIVNASGSMSLTGSRISAPLLTTGVVLTFSSFTGSLHWVAIGNI